MVLAIGGAVALGAFAHARWGWGTCGPGAMGPGWGTKAGTLTLDAVPAVVEGYLVRYGDPDFTVAEIMEFTNHFYVEVREERTGQGAMELLVLRDGSVRPEPGPNMMWNAKYGHMGMMAFSQPEMPVTPEEAQALAQAYLDRNEPGLTAGDPEAFDGYYTLHTLRDGEISGMLSVNGYTGEIWLHTWHGAFLGMVELGS